MTPADGITAFSAAIAAISFGVGVSAWKREFMGRRRMELAENVLAKFYEAEEAILAIRNPMGRSEEGRSRQRSDTEKPEESQALDQAYVHFERRNKHRELFADLQSLKFRYKATFGKLSFVPFEQLRVVLNEMSSAASELGKYWWPRETQGKLSEEDDKKKRECEAIFWRTLSEDGEDEISKRIRKSVQQVEDLLQAEVRSQTLWLRRAWRWCMHKLEKPDNHARISSEARGRLSASPS